jgi:hypothetical protein
VCAIARLDKPVPGGTSNMEFVITFENYLRVFVGSRGTTAEEPECLLTNRTLISDTHGRIGHLCPVLGTSLGPFYLNVALSNPYCFIFLRMVRTST